MFVQSLRALFSQYFTPKQVHQIRVTVDVLTPAVTYTDKFAKLYHSAAVTDYVQGPKVFPQKTFPIDYNAFSSLLEALYCVVSMFDSIYFVIAVKINDWCTHCTS